MSGINCSKCNKPVTPAEKFCSHCGAPQDQPLSETKTCAKCKHVNPSSAAFCEKCGTSLTAKQVTTPPSPPESNKIVSKGNYSGSMVKSKSKFWKRFKVAIIISLVVIVIAMIVWFQVDPDAGKKLTNILFGIVLMAAFAFYIYRKSKKGKGRRRGRGSRGGNRNDDDHDVDHDQYDDDDNDYDDGGDDD